MLDESPMIPETTDTSATAGQTLPAFAFPGRSLIVACDRKVLDLRVCESADDDGSFAALAPRLLVREGLTLGIRVFDDGCVWRLAYEIARADAISPAEAEVSLALLDAEQIGDERAAPRAPYKTLATVRSVYYAAYELGAFGVHTIEVSRVAIAFECERRFELGTKFDLALDDEVGQTIFARIEIVRTEPGTFGRMRVFGRFIAIDEVDRVLLDRLISRTLLRAVSEPAEPAPPTLREQLAPAPQRRGLGRLLRRSA
jgi:hypothetical protein